MKLRYYQREKRRRKGTGLSKVRKKWLDEYNFNFIARIIEMAISL